MISAGHMSTCEGRYSPQESQRTNGYHGGCIVPRHGVTTMHHPEGETPTDPRLYHESISTASTHPFFDYFNIATLVPLPPHTLLVSSHLACWSSLLSVSTPRQHSHFSSRELNDPKSLSLSLTTACTMQILLSITSLIALSAGALALPADINGTLQLSEREYAPFPASISMFDNGDW